MFQNSRNINERYSPPSSNTRTFLDSCVSLLPEDPLVNTKRGQEPEVFSLYPKEYHKTVLALCLMILSTMFNGIVAALVTDLVPRTPMPDILFKIFPEQAWAWQVSDTITMTLSFVHIVFGMLHKHRWIITRRFCFISSQLYLLRGVCMAVTWVAVPGVYHATRCVPLAKPELYWETIIVRITRFMLSLGLSAEADGNHHLCGDLIFSGHTLIVVLSWYSLDIHLPHKRCRFLRILAGLAALFAMAMIVLCRMHYTVDVVLAFAITTSYFIIYHTIVLNQTDNQWRSYTILVFWILPIMEYFEKNVPRAKLPRELEWPFSRPLFVRQIVKKLND